MERWTGSCPWPLRLRTFISSRLRSLRLPRSHWSWWAGHTGSEQVAHCAGKNSRTFHMQNFHFRPNSNHHATWERVCAADIMSSYVHIVKSSQHELTRSRIHNHDKPMLGLSWAYVGGKRMVCWAHVGSRLDEKNAFKFNTLFWPDVGSKSMSVHVGPLLHDLEGIQGLSWPALWAKKRKKKTNMLHLHLVHAEKFQAPQESLGLLGGARRHWTGRTLC